MKGEQRIGSLLLAVLISLCSLRAYALEESAAVPLSVPRQEHSALGESGSESAEEPDRDFEQNQTEESAPEVRLEAESEIVLPGEEIRLWGKVLGFSGEYRYRWSLGEETLSAGESRDEEPALAVLPETPGEHRYTLEAESVHDPALRAEASVLVEVRELTLRFVFEARDEAVSPGAGGFVTGVAYELEGGGSGRFEFPGLEDRAYTAESGVQAGRYTVKVSAPAGYRATVKNETGILSGEERELEIRVVVEKEEDAGFRKIIWQEDGA